MPFFTRSSACIARLAKPEVPGVGRVHYASTETQLKRAWADMATQFKDQVSRQLPPSNQVQHGELGQGMPAVPEFPDEDEDFPQAPVLPPRAPVLPLPRAAPAGGGAGGGGGKAAARPQRAVRPAEPPQVCPISG